jgi:maleate isomerase
MRVGLIVPSSNVTIETELPALLARHESATFTFHSSRMRMQEVSEEELQTMNVQMFPEKGRRNSRTMFRP